jgi:enhancing lycopene biosynthesis protein 2
MNIGVLLSGNGVYDGAEIQEAVLTLLAIDEMGWNAVCISVDKPQHHVINHLSGEVMDESRNMLVEAARIARGQITPIDSISPADIDALVIPGGFGSAKNFTSWAFDGPESTILPEVKLLLVNLVNVGKPIVALCVSPVVVAKAFEGSSIHPTLSLGSASESSPYDINSFNEGLRATGAIAQERTIREVLIDPTNRIICAPCYMMDARITEINANIKQAMVALNEIR